ncbi:MAG TPA: carboxypeptidase-like regulatory domain-containing protein, partial [Anaerolineae bacterium]
MKQQPITSPLNKMNKNQYSAWFRLVLSVVFTFVLVALVQTALITRSSTAGEVVAASNSALSIAENTAVFTITGVVGNVNDQPVPSVQVFAFSGASQVETVTDNNGQYALTLTSGNSYDIVFNPPTSSNLASQARRGINGTTTLDVTLPPGHAISGTVYRDATKTNPVANTAIFAFNRQTFDGFGLPPSKADGTFQISLEESDWELTFTPPPFTQLGPTRT